jgi:hypothetical protein
MGLYNPEYAINIIVPTQVFSVSVRNFIELIAKNGGMATSNNFIVKFINPPVSIPELDAMSEHFCSEAQLPNINTAQGNVNGVYVGSGSVPYAHTRVFTEMQLGFQLDANLGMLKFLNKWNDYIFDGSYRDSSMPQERENATVETAQTSYKPKNRTVRLNYPQQYMCDIAISKQELAVGQRPRSAITYILENAYPYAVDAVPLQFGSTQIASVTAQFAYMRHYTVNNDIKNLAGFVE